MKKHLLICSVLLTVFSPALAKRVSDRTHTFSIEVPDEYRFTSPPPNVPKTPNTIYMMNSAKTSFIGLRGIRDYKAKKADLDQWADLSATLFATVTQTPAGVMEYTAGGEPARILLGVLGRMCQSTVLITKKGTMAAMVMVIDENSEADHGPKAKALFESFTWDK